MLNKCCMMGNVGNAPEIRNTQDGNKIVSFSLATSESWKNKSGERTTKTEWHKVVIFSQGLASVVERFVSKGSKIYIEGQLKTRKWTDASGVDKYTTEIVLSNFDSKLILLDGKTDRPREEAPVSESAGNEDIIDEIPF